MVIREFRLRSFSLPFFIPAFFWACSTGVILPVLPLYIRTLGASLSHTGFIIAAFAFGTLLGNIPAGLIISKIGKKRSMGFAVLSEAVIACSVLLVTRPWLLFPILFSLGCSHTLFFLSRLSYFQQTVPNNMRGRALSLLSGGSRLGSAVGPVLGGYVADMMGYSIVFLFYAAFNVLVLLFILLFIEESNYNITTNYIINYNIISIKETLKIISNDPRKFFPPLFSVLTLKIIRQARKVIFPLWGDLIGMSANSIGIVFGISSVIEWVLFYPAGWIMDRWGRKFTAVPCLSLFSVAFLFLPIARVPILFMLIATFVAIGNGIGGPINMTLSTDLTPEKRPIEFLSVWRTTTDVGTVASPVIIGMASSALGLAAAAPVIAVIGIVGALVMAFAVTEPLKPVPTTLL